MKNWPSAALCANSPANGHPPATSASTDAEAGDEVLLVNYENHPVNSPYRMRFAIFVRKGKERYDAADQMPEQLRCRALAVRAFDGKAMMVGYELVEGRDLEASIERLFDKPRAAYLHVQLCCRRAATLHESNAHEVGTKPN
jgi:hypothetical protein